MQFLKIVIVALVMLGPAMSTICANHSGFKAPTSHQETDKALDDLKAHFLKLKEEIARVRKESYEAIARLDAAKKEDKRVVPTKD